MTGGRVILRWTRQREVSGTRARHYRIVVEGRRYRLHVNEEPRPLDWAYAKLAKLEAQGIEDARR